MSLIKGRERRDTYTDKEKVEAFDALVEELQGTERCVGHVNREKKQSTLAAVYDWHHKTAKLGDATAEFEKVPIYEWRLINYGDKDVERGIIKMSKEKREKEVIDESRKRNSLQASADNVGEVCADLSGDRS